jgi:hypothetical protein
MLKSANKPLRRYDISHMTELVMNYILTTLSCISRTYSENSENSFFHVYRLRAMFNLLSHLCNSKIITLLTLGVKEFRYGTMY